MRKLIILLLLSFFFISKNAAMDLANIEDHKSNPLVAHNHPIKVNEVARFDELKPNDKRDKKIISFIKKYLILNESLEEQTSNKYGRIFLKSLGLLIGSTAGIPYINVLCKAVHKNPALCITLGAGETLSYGSAVAWLSLRLTSHMDPMSEEERYFKLGNNSQYCKNALANFLGLLSTIPDFYLLFQYNNVKWLSIHGCLISYIFKTQGFYEFFNIITKTKQSLLKRDDFEESYLGKASTVEKDIIPCLFKPNSNVGSQDEILEKIANLFNNSTPNLLQTTNSDASQYKYILQRAFQSFGLIFPISSLFVETSLTFSALKPILPEILLYPATIFTVTPGFALDLVITSLIMEDIFNSIYDIFTSNTKPNYISYYYPSTNKVLPFFAITLAFLSGMGDWFISSEVTSNSSITAIRSLENILPFILFGGTLIFESYAGNDLIKNFIKEFDSRWGSRHKKEVLRTHKSLETVKNCFESSAYLGKREISNQTTDEEGYYELAIQERRKNGKVYERLDQDSLTEDFNPINSEQDEAY